MGNLDSYRDWGHSKDYVRAMHLILQHDKPDDFVVSTGETRSIRDLCRIVFEMLEMNYEDHVIINPKYFRPQELPYLCGDCTKIKTILKWEPKYSFEELVQEMVESYYEIMK